MAVIVSEWCNGCHFALLLLVLVGAAMTEFHNARNNRIGVCCGTI